MVVGLCLGPAALCEIRALQETDVMLTLNHSRLVSLGRAAGLVASVGAQLHAAVAAVLPLFSSSSLYTAPLGLQPRSWLW